MGDEVFLDAVLAVGTADTTLLHTCMEALDGLEVLAVDVGLAELQLAAGLHSHVQVLGEDGGCQTVLAVVGPGDHLIDGLELDERDHGAEGLLMDDVHVLRAPLSQRLGCSSCEFIAVHYIIPPEIWYNGKLDLY